MIDRLYAIDEAMLLVEKFSKTYYYPLVKALERLLVEHTGKNAVTTKGNRSVAVGENIKNSNNITGDRNKVENQVISEGSNIFDRVLVSCLGFDSIRFLYTGFLDRE
ncbi:MAG: hypothetical protein ACYC6R_03390 [Anaerolineales bacterium]